jgi:hypothetical protein
MDNRPYTYLIGWSKLNKWYYGLRYAKDCHPTDLWTSYFTSSKYVAWMREFYGEPDVIQIRKIFNSKEKAILWEHIVLKRIGVIFKDKWLNKTDNRALQCNKKQSAEHIRKRTTNKNVTEKYKAAALKASKAASLINTGKKQLLETQIKKRETFYKNYEKNIIAFSKPRRQYKIEGKIYNGHNEVIRDFNISPYLLNKRLKSIEYPTWIKIK